MKGGKTQMKTKQLVYAYSFTHNNSHTHNFLYECIREEKEGETQTRSLFFYVDADTNNRMTCI